MERYQDMREGPDVNSEYVGSVCWAMHAEKDERGIPIPPKSMLEIEGRQDAPMWWDSAEQEWEGLDDRGCFEHDITKAELKRRGINKRIIGSRFIFESKLDDKLAFRKAKGRCVEEY